MSLYIWQVKVFIFYMLLIESVSVWMLIRSRFPDRQLWSEMIFIYPLQMCLCYFFQNRERGITYLCVLTSSFSISFTMNVFLTNKQQPLLFSLYSANHSCHSSVSLYCTFLLPRARFLSVCLTTAHVKSGTQIKSKLCTHVSDPEVLGDPVAPSPTPLPLFSFSRLCQGSRGDEGGGAAGRPYPGENSPKAALMNIHLWRWLGLWHVILAETRDLRRPWCEAGGVGGGEEEHKGPWPIPLPSAVQA